MKRIVVYLLKCALAAVISIVLLSLFSLVYYNPPIVIEQADGITNSKFIPNYRWSFMLEGVGFGKTDSLGYNNAYYDDCTNPDIVFMGSSHLEGLQVSQKENCVYVLNEKFDKDDLSYNDFKCLNLGTSGHFFGVSANNFKYVAEKFNGAKYIVIEVSEIKFSPSELDDIIEGKFHQPMEKKGFIAETARKIPFIRLMYKKFNESSPADNNTSNEENVSTEADEDLSVYSEKMNIVLAGISEISKENGVIPIIVMHEQFWEESDGSIVTITDDKYNKAFENCCDVNGIKLIDITPVMIENYKEKYEFSYGFSNTAPGEGHLNRNGHRIMAETVYTHINEMEAGK